MRAFTLAGVDVGIESDTREGPGRRFYTSAIYVEAASEEEDNDRAALRMLAATYRAMADDTDRIAASPTVAGGVER